MKKSRVRQASSLLGIAVIGMMGGYAEAANSKEYPVGSIDVYAHIRCDGNGALTEVMSEDPGSSSSFKRRREFSANISALSGPHFIFLMDKHDFEFEVDSMREITFIQKSRFFGRDRMVKIGRLDIKQACLGHSDRVVSTLRRIEPAPSISVSARMMIASGCQSRSNWPHAGYTYWRDIEEVLTFSDLSSGEMLVFSRDANIAYADESSCKEGKLP